MADMLVTASELASYVQADVDTATATLAIQAATGAVQAACKQRLIQVIADTVSVLTESWSQWLELPQRPVTAVTSVTIGATAVTDYMRSGARLWRRDGWQSATGAWVCEPVAVAVTYSHGYAATDPGLQLARQAVLELAAMGYNNPSGAQALGIDDYRESYGPENSRPALADARRRELRRAYGITVGMVRMT